MHFFQKFKTSAVILLLAVFVYACGGGNPSMGDIATDDNTNDEPVETSGFVLSSGPYDLDLLDAPSWDCISRELAVTLPAAHMRAAIFTFDDDGGVLFAVSRISETFTINDTDPNRFLGSGVYSQVDANTVVFGSTQEPTPQEDISGILTQITPISQTKFSARLSVNFLAEFEIECILVKDVRSESGSLLDSFSVEASDAPGIRIHTLLTKVGQSVECSGTDANGVDFSFEFLRKSATGPLVTDVHDHNAGKVALTGRTTGSTGIHDMIYTIDVGSGNIGVVFQGNTGKFIFLMDDVDVLSRGVLKVRDFVILGPSGAGSTFESLCILAV